MLQSLNLIYYTNELFEKCKYIFGNTCENICTDDKFIHSTPMRSKDEAGM